MHTYKKKKRYLKSAALVFYADTLCSTPGWATKVFGTAHLHGTTLTVFCIYHLLSEVVHLLHSRLSRIQHYKWQLLTHCNYVAVINTLWFILVYKTSPTILKMESYGSG